MAGHNRKVPRILTPTSSTIILSKPTGPKELFTIFDTEHAAITETKINHILDSMV